MISFKVHKKKERQVYYSHFTHEKNPWGLESLNKLPLGRPPIEIKQLEFRPFDYEYYIFFNEVLQYLLPLRDSSF